MSDLLFPYSERSAIEAWLAKGSSSPLTGEPMRGSKLVPNHSLKRIIEEYRHLMVPHIAFSNHLGARRNKLPESRRKC